MRMWDWMVGLAAYLPLKVAYSVAEKLLGLMYIAFDLEVLMETHYPW
jgi:hypothetical protein